MRSNRALFSPSRRWLALLLLVALPAVGCGGGGTPVQFTSDPPGATLSIRQPDGREIVKGTAPLQRSIPFGEKLQTIHVVAQPSRAAEENYEQTTVQLTAADLPATRGQPAKYIVALPQRESVVLETWMPVYHPRDGWIAARTRVRSYNTVVEDDGTAPEQVAALAPLLRVTTTTDAGEAPSAGVGVWGLDVSDIDNGRLVTSVFEVGEATKLGAKDPETIYRLKQPDAPEPKEGQTAPEISSTFRNDIAQAQIVSLRLPGLAEERITSDRYADMTPAFSANGEYLFFASNRDRAERSDVFRRPSTRRGALDVVTRYLPNGGALHPSQASDGTVVFGFVPEDAASLDDGQVYAKIGGLGGYDSLVVPNGVQPRISPDGQQIAYINRGDLWLCSIDGSEQRRLTTDAESLIEQYAEKSLSKESDRRRFEQFEQAWMTTANATPAWSPDGKFIVFSSLAGLDGAGRPNYDIHVITPDGLRAQVTTNGSLDVLPRFSPDGRSIYFLSNRGQQWAVWKLPVPSMMSEAGE